MRSTKPKSPFSFQVVVFILSITTLQLFGSLIMSIEGEGQLTWEDVIIHPGDLIVDGNETLLIENCTFIVTGIVAVRDNATLIVRDAELNVSTSTLAGMVILENDGTLIIGDGKLNFNYDLDPSIHSIARICDVDITDTATLDVKESRISSKLRQIRFRIGRHGRSILNSTSISESNIEAFDDSEISIDESPIYSIKLHGNSSCVVQHADIRHFSGSDRFIASFCNSKIEGIEFVFGSSSKVIMKGRLQGFHRYWNIYSNLTVEGIECNMTLRDTNVTGPVRLDSEFTSTGMELRILNQNLLSADIGSDSELHISNCTIKRLFCGRHDSIYSISESKIGLLSVIDNSFLSVSETEIDNLDISDFEGVLVFDNVILYESLELGLGVPGSQFYMSGGLGLGANFSIDEGQFSIDTGPNIEGPSYRANLTGPMQKFKVKRGFRVVALQNGEPLEKVQLKLYNEESETIWEGVADGNGKADFNITYCKNWILPPGYYYSNQTKTWSLEAIYGHLSLATDVALLSETPIKFNFLKPKPLWAFWQFWAGITIITASVFVTLYVNTRKKRS